MNLSNVVNKWETYKFPLSFEFFIAICYNSANSGNEEKHWVHVFWLSSVGILSSRSRFITVILTDLKLFVEIKLYTLEVHV